MLDILLTWRPQMASHPWLDMGAACCLGAPVGLMRGLSSPSSGFSSGLPGLSHNMADGFQEDTFQKDEHQCARIYRAALAPLPIGQC